MITFSADQADRAARLLADGEIVAIPTDTVYGLAASLRSEEGIRRIFLVKRRPEHVALPVLVSSLEQAREVIGHVDVRLEVLARAFWPGPLTVVTSAPSEVASRVGSTTPTLGLRCPDDPVVRALLAEVGPLCVTSANEHGRPPCTSAGEVLEILDGRGVAGVLDGGLRNAQPSTVLELTTDGVVELRSGPISMDDVGDVLA
jgi:L-threonylcarbamoyladenylate synthase